MKEIRAVLVGYGNAARLHRSAYPPEVKVIGVVDADRVKVTQAEKDGFRAYNGLESAINELGQDCDFWDICVPNESHFSITAQLLEGGAKNILVEKPVCMTSEIKATRDLASRFPEAKIVVQENYISSQVVKMAREKIQELGITSHTILTEMTKNRVQDILNGRFIDEDLGVFGYEAVHMITAVAGLGKGKLPREICFATTTDMKLPNGKILKNQGSGSIVYSTHDESSVILYTSMMGQVFFDDLKAINPPADIPEGNPTRYRIICVGDLRGLETTIIAQFEPMPGYQRGMGRVVIIKSGNIEEEILVEDKSMNAHILGAIKYFLEEEENPCTVEKALAMVEFLAEVKKEARI